MSTTLQAGRQLLLCYSCCGITSNATFLIVSVKTKPVLCNVKMAAKLSGVESYLQKYTETESIHGQVLLGRLF